MAAMLVDDRGPLAVSKSVAVGRHWGYGPLRPRHPARSMSVQDWNAKLSNSRTIIVDDAAGHGGPGRAGPGRLEDNPN